MTESIQKRFANALSMIVGGTIIVLLFAAVIYVGLGWQLAGYDRYAKCSPQGRISRIEWFFGARPLNENCWR
jgi:hypothetical protein